MLIVCPNCATSYRVEPLSLGSGRSVRCVRCRSVWIAAPPEPMAEAGAGAGAVDWTAPFSTGEPTVADVPDSVEAFQDQPLAPFDPGPIQADPIRDENTLWAPAPSAEPRFGPPIADDWLARDAAPAADARKRIPTSIKDALDDIETFAARRIKRRNAQGRRQWSVPVLPTAIMVLLVANIILIGWRSDVVKILPQTASLYAAVGLPVNLRGLAFSSVTTTTESQDGVPVLVVEGTIEATSKRVVQVPRLRISLLNPSGQEVYAWTALPSRSLLSPGETLAFRSRLASPPADGHDVIVRFFNHRDLVAGLQ